MRRETLVIGVLVLAVLLPMWYVGLQGESPSEEIEIDQSVSEIQPLAAIVDTPNKLSPSQVGVVVWWALFVLVGALTAAHRFMNRAVRTDTSPKTVAADGGRSVTVGIPWLTAESRWVVTYYAASESTSGIVVMGALTVLAIVFAALFSGEYLTLARTQYFGVYAAGLFLSLAALTVAYYAWFMPHVEVVERRGH
jgi:hypothetical protein